MDDIFKAALGVEAPWFIESVAFDAEHKRLDIRLAFERGSRFEVENAAGVAVACPVYDTVEKSWRHLSFFQHECYLHARVPRVTTDGGRIAMALPPWCGKLAGFTLLFEALLIQLCAHMPVHQVMKMTNVSDYKLWRMLDVYVQAAQTLIKTGGTSLRWVWMKPRLRRAMRISRCSLTWPAAKPSMWLKAKAARR